MLFKNVIYSIAIVFNLRCYIAGDINSFDLPKEEFYGKNDRVISIEMFEHMKNYELLLEKVSNWLKPEGKVRNVPWIAAFHLNIPCSLCLYSDSAQFAAYAYHHDSSILKRSMAIKSFNMSIKRLHILNKCHICEVLTPIYMI